MTDIVEIQLGRLRKLLADRKIESELDIKALKWLVFAGNDSEGLRYGTIKTEEKFFLKWKEDEDGNSGYKLDRYLLKMCRKERQLAALRQQLNSTPLAHEDWDY